jgi:hypothetical protein
LKINDIIEASPRTARTVQCLYCDSELKPFRGLFDEDFCCREHRDKYFASFRKAVNRLPVLDFPPAPDPASAPASRCLEEPVVSSGSPKIPAETHDLPRATADERGGHVDAHFTPPIEIPAEPLEAPSPFAAYTAGEPADAELSVDSDEIAFGPPAADFRPVAIAATAGAQPAHGASLDALPVSYAIELPAGMTTWSAALALEQRPAELLDPREGTAATPFAPIPTSLELSAENPTLSATAPRLPDSAESAANAPFQMAFGYASPWNYADPLPPAPLALALASFSPEADGAAWMPSAEFAEIASTCQPLASSPMAATEITLAHEFHTPVFTPSAGPMLADEERDEIHEEDALSPDSAAPSEIAPAFVMNSSPLDSPAFMPARAAEMMPPALALSSAASPLSTPGLASTFDGQPSLGPELMADIPQTPAANQPAQPRSLAPLRQLFGSSVRIKNWRLRITFAKPA